jgi:hypothetical protein
MQYKITGTDEVLHEGMLRNRFPNVSLPSTLSQGDLDFLGLEVVPDPEPIPLTEEEIAAKALAEAIAAAQAMQAAILQGMTTLFDQTAQSRHYDNRVTCALRAGYPGPFHAEGAAFATWMDSCNATAYTMLAQVQAGTMPMPATVDAALALLPAMVWPV